MAKAARVLPIPAAAGAAYVSQGMISPATAFVNGDGVLLPVSFRFLFGVFQAIELLNNQLGSANAEITTLQQRLGAAGIP